MLMDMALAKPDSLLLVDNNLNLETTGAAATTSLLELASLAPDVWLHAIVGVGVVDGSSLTEVRQCLATGRTTKQNGVGAGGCPQGKLIKGEALSSSSDDAFASILGERKGAHTHLGAFHHTNIISDLSDNNSNLSVLIGHVLSKAVQADRRCVDLGHVQTLSDGVAEFGVRSAREEFVQFDEETGVGILGLDDFGRGLVSAAAASGFKIDTHDELFLWITIKKNGEHQWDATFICA
jgi:hypothetical protein